MSIPLSNSLTYRAADFGSEEGLHRRREIVTLGDAFAFVVPLLQVIEVPVAGTLLAADLAMIVALPLALIRHSDRLRMKPIRTILMLGGLWLLGQIATDLFRESVSEDYLRGWIKIIFVLINFMVVWLVVCGSRRRFMIYTVGMALGTIAAYYVHPTLDAVLSPWKFSLGIPVTMLVALFASRFKEYRLLGILLPLSVLAVTHVHQDCRMLAIIALITAIYSIFLMSQERESLGTMRRAALILLVVLGIGGFGSIYSYYAKQGVFGKYAQQKTEAQSAGEGGALLGGRREILASSQAIIDSPILGHGSWARDPKYSALLQQRSDDLGYKRFQGGKLDDLIPTHSYIFGSWVDGGIAGGIFWLYILFYTVYTTFNASGREPLLPFFAFAGLMLTWDTLFSPLGTPTRFVAPFFVAAIILFRRFQTNPIEYEWES
jgi:hypothetical protein